MELQTYRFLALLGLAAAAPAFSAPDIHRGPGNFADDLAICRAFLTGKDDVTCSQLADLIRKQATATSAHAPAPMTEGDPDETCYYLERKLAIVELVGGELLIETVDHYYLLDGDRIFVTRVITPHEDEMRGLSEKPLTAQDLAPDVHGLLFRGGTLLKSYAVQGTKHLQITRSDAADAMSIYRDLLGLKPLEKAGSTVTGIRACPVPP